MVRRTESKSLNGITIDTHVLDIMMFYKLEMCSCSTKGRASLVIEAEEEGEAEEDWQGQGWQRPR